MGNWDPSRRFRDAHYGTRVRGHGVQGGSSEDEIEEALEELDKNQKNDANNDDDDLMWDDDETVTDDVTEIISKREALDCIDKLKKYCDQKSMNKVSVNKLNSFEKDLMHLTIERSTIQKTITCFTTNT